MISAPKYYSNSAQPLPSTFSLRVLVASPKRISRVFHLFFTNTVNLIFILYIAFLSTVYRQLTPSTATEIRDWDFINKSTIQLTHNFRYMEDLISHYPEHLWDKNKSPYRIAIRGQSEDKPQRSNHSYLLSASSLMVLAQSRTRAKTGVVA